MARSRDIKLELAWEAIQEPYISYANILAYSDPKGLKSFCSFGEKTYLIKVSNNKTEAYYDINEQIKAAEEGLQDFLDPQWIKVFLKKSIQSTENSKRFVEKYYQKKNLTKKEIFQAIKEGSKALNHAFVSFQACQPQYTSLVESYIRNLLDSKLSKATKNNIITILSFSENKTFLLEEEIALSKLIKKLKSKSKKLPNLKDYSFKELDRHAFKFGFIGATDGLGPWSKEDLYKRLKKNWNQKNILTKADDWKKQKRKIKQQKKDLIKKYKVSPKVVKICNNIALLGRLRLELRVNGWMPIHFILIQELLPQLGQYVPYTAKQLENCIYPELKKIIKGDYSLTPKELNQRRKLLFYGILNGQGKLWFGSQAKQKIKELIPKINKNIKELEGQTATPGKVSGPCYVIRWDAEDLKSTISKIPKGSILIAGQTRPQLMPAIKKASAIITDEGGVLSHAAIISRELNIPCIIGTKFATQVFKTGDKLEVDADRGIVKKT